MVISREFSANNGQMTTKNGQLTTTLRMTGKITYLAYNRSGGDKCFRSLLTPHSARTIVRAVPYVGHEFSNFFANTHP
ncbi:MAG: hypothetical protein LW708_06735 [Anabaena sp. 49628_E55]|uniref:hypothetical protein n=2 Tax=Dolichospermum circinale TaxID=109265 RepID=UPI00232C4EEA|nr:hypothetical protein [Dolichospermum circinale]MCE2718510.1 hypothetical protein [Anabaena sp. 49628_E55]